MQNQPLTDLDGEPSIPEEGPARAGPALTITVQSWATPVVGLAMLALGILAGYFGRPILDTSRTSGPAGVVSNAPAPDPAEGLLDDQSARQQALMESLIPQTVHFKGDPDAPVTLIEFSDFQ